MQPDRVLSLPEVQSRLSVGRSTVYKLAHEGRLELVKIGTRTGIRESEVQRFLSALTPAPVRKCMAQSA